MEKVVVLDAGHGGINPITGQYVTAGKRSPQWPDGSIYYEGVGNRAIALKVAKLLVANGITVHYTVKPEDYRDISLDRRCAIANNIYAKNKNCILISIHSNASDNETAKGYEVFTSPGKSISDKIADHFLDRMKAKFPNLKPRLDNSDGDGDKEANFAMVKGTKCPAILIESMFHTNRFECAILQSEEGKDKIAQVILETVLDYFNS